MSTAIPLMAPNPSTHHISNATLGTQTYLWESRTYQTHPAHHCCIKTGTSTSAAANPWQDLQMKTPHTAARLTLKHVSNDHELNFYTANISLSYHQPFLHRHCRDQSLRSLSFYHPKIAYNAFSSSLLCVKSLYNLAQILKYFAFIFFFFFFFCPFSEKFTF